MKKEKYNGSIDKAKGIGLMLIFFCFLFAAKYNYSHKIISSNSEANSNIFKIIAIFFCPFLFYGFYLYAINIKANLNDFFIEVPEKIKMHLNKFYPYYIWLFLMAFMLFLFLMLPFISEKHELWLAAERGNINTIRTLINDGADLNATDERGDSALIISVFKGNEEIVKLLLDGGANPNIHDKDFPSALMIVYNENIALYLIKAGASINEKDHNGDTPLIYAVRLQHSKIAKMLIATGADIDVSNKEGETALSIANKIGDQYIKNIIIEAKAKNQK